MKKNIIFILLLALGVDNIYAQKGFSIEYFGQPGISMGGEYYAHTIDISIKKTFTFNMKYGVLLGYNFNNNLGVSAGIHLDHLGQNYDDLANSDNGYIYTEGKSISLTYFKIPFLINYTVNPKKQISFTFSTGIYFGFLYSYEDKYKYSSGSGFDYTTANGSSFTSDYNNISTSFVNGNPYNTTDFGGILAAGIQFNLSENISIPIMLNYNIGFSDIKNEASQYTYINSTKLYWGNGKDQNSTLAFHNSSFGLKIGFKINL
ncbi:MAG: outer membrane beta-barrel protein [Bacteroidetes bacterium]|nr:outer membrane beta-barrel protein [Bacteroidota bacterium]